MPKKAKKTRCEHCSTIKPETVGCRIVDYILLRDSKTMRKRLVIAVSAEAA